MQICPFVQWFSICLKHLENSSVNFVAPCINFGPLTGMSNATKKESKIFLSQTMAWKNYFMESLIYWVVRHLKILVLLFDMWRACNYKVHTQTLTQVFVSDICVGCEPLISVCCWAWDTEWMWSLTSTTAKNEGQQKSLYILNSHWKDWIKLEDRAWILGRSKSGSSFFQPLFSFTEDILHLGIK